ncbi:MAG: VCBS repeat-containing protein [Firmicutes bacterium]|nr:VCBS repeat-containing protein [Bacillota bacterium]
MEYAARQAIIVRRTADVTGDSVPDQVWLTGVTTEDSPFIQDITLMVQNGRTGRITQVALSENAGYDPTLFLCDFTGDGVLDVKVSIQSGGSGGFVFTYIYSFANNQVRQVFSGERYEQGQEFEAFYTDGYVVVVHDLRQELTFTIDVSRDPAAADLYNPDGTLKEATAANVGPFIMALPIILDESTERCDLMALTRVYGTFAADTLGFIQDYLTWDGSSFRTVRKELATFPREGTE